MKQTFILPLLASSLLVACATPTPPMQDKPTVIGQPSLGNRIFNAWRNKGNKGRWMRVNNKPKRQTMLSPPY